MVPRQITCNKQVISHIYNHSREGEFSMNVVVCRNHVKEGLLTFPIPHARKLPEFVEVPCHFCKKKAKVKLFVY